MTGALVGSRRKLWSSAVAVLVGVVQFLDKVVVPVGATIGVAQCLVRRWIHVVHHPGRLLELFYDFLHEGVGSAFELDSRPAAHCRPRQWHVPCWFDRYC